MSIPYRTQRRIKRIGTVVGVIALLAIAAWFCWVIWLERYIVYTDEGASLDLSLSAYDVVGEEAVEPVAQGNVSIYYNEGSDAILTSNELTQLNGYYISADMLQKNLTGIWSNLDILAAGTPVMIELKGGYGSFYYTSSLDDAVQSASISITSVNELIQAMKDKGFYVIGRVSTLRDYNFGLNHVPSGLYMLSRAGLWPDAGGCYWLDPTNATTSTWISSYLLELKGLGFNEVVLADFRFPDSDQYIFNGDKTEALKTLADKLVKDCASSNFTISFLTDDPAFSLPEGRCRLYLEGVDASQVSATAAKVTVSDAGTQLVFLASTNDTRFENYGVLRTLDVAPVIEAQKADLATGQ